MAVSRRGAVFTLMAIVIVSFLFAVELSTRDVKTVELSDTEVARARVAMMDRYLQTFEDHVELSLGNAGYFALQNMSIKIEKDKRFLSDTNQTFASCVNTSNTISFAGTAHTCLPVELTLNESIDRLVDLAHDQLGIQTTYTITRIWLSEERPFEVVAWVNLSYKVIDPVYASWEVNDKVLRTSINMEGIRDPVYSYLYANLSVIPLGEMRNFSPSRFKRFQMNYTNFPSHYANRSYSVVEGLGPSVLQRYMGVAMENASSNFSECCGIESIVVRETFIGGTAAYANYSFIDHHLVSHLRNITTEPTKHLAPFDCVANEVEGWIASPSKVLPLETYRFANVYNLSINSTLECAWT